MFQKSPSTPGKHKKKKGDQVTKLQKTADDLDAISSALTNTSRELLTPPQASTSKATRPPSSIILDTEQTKQTTFVQETANNYIEKVDNNEESE